MPPLTYDAVCILDFSPCPAHNHPANKMPQRGCHISATAPLSLSCPTVNARRKLVFFICDDLFQRCRKTCDSLDIRRNYDFCRLAVRCRFKCLQALDRQYALICTCVFNKTDTICFCLLYLQNCQRLAFCFLDLLFLLSLCTENSCLFLSLRIQDCRFFLTFCYQNSGFFSPSALRMDSRRSRSAFICFSMAS